MHPFKYTPNLCIVSPPPEGKYVQGGRGMNESRSDFKETSHYNPVVHGMTGGQSCQGNDNSLALCPFCGCVRPWQSVGVPSGQRSLCEEARIPACSLALLTAGQMARVKTARQGFRRLPRGDYMQRFDSWEVVELTTRPLWDGQELVSPHCENRFVFVLLIFLVKYWNGGNKSALARTHTHKH